MAICGVLASPRWENGLLRWVLGPCTGTRTRQPAVWVATLSDLVATNIYLPQNSPSRWGGPKMELSPLATAPPVPRNSPTLINCPQVGHHACQPRCHGPGSLASTSLHGINQTCIPETAHPGKAPERVTCLLLPLPQDRLIKMHTVIEFLERGL